MQRLCQFIVFILATVSLSWETEDVGTVIGIDLGTTYSCVGIFKKGRVEIIANDQGSRTTPSYVAFIESGERLIGDGAKNQVARNPENTIFNVKRLIGRTWDDDSLQSDMKYLPYKVLKENNKPLVEVHVGDEMKRFAPEEISAMVLLKMKETAEAYLGKKVTHAVVTVPAYFNDAQRRATHDAGTISGLNIMKIINEPSAAAIAFGLESELEDQDDFKNILVFDLGGGTFDVSLMTLSKGLFKVRAISGNTHLGGEDFDRRVMDYFVQVFKKKTGLDVREDKRATQKLRIAVEKAKRVISYQMQDRIEIDSLYGGHDFSETLSRAKFEELNRDLFRSTMAPVKQVLEDSGISKSDIHEVLLVGGSTRIPKIQQLVKELFNGKTPSKQINPDEAVAFGAAVQGGILSGEDMLDSLILQDVIPLSLGVSLHGGLMDIVVKRNSEIPCKNTEVYTTVKNDLTSLFFRVYEGERPVADENHYLGGFTLHGIPPAPAGVANVGVTFEVNVNGILKVTAVDTATGSTGGITITNDQNSLGMEEIERMIEASEKYAQEDERVRQRIRARNELEMFAYSVKTQAEDREGMGGKLSEDNREKVINAAEADLDYIRVYQDEDKHVYEQRKMGLRRIVWPIVGQLYKDEL